MDNSPSKIIQVLDKASLTPLGFLGLAFLFLIPFIPGLNSEFLLRWLIVAAFLGAASIAFDFSSGYINVVNFGFMAIAGVGGYASAIFTSKYGLSPFFGLVAAAVIAGFLGFLLGIISLRLRGIFAACLLWFAGLALMGLATKMVWLTRGPLGLTVERMFGTGNTPYLYTILTIMIVFYVISQTMVRGNMGLAFKAIGQNMDAARTSGVSPLFFRLTNFTISCAMAGVLGCFYAHYYGILTPEVMHTNKTIEVLVISFIGGRGTIWGGAAVAFPFQIAMEYLRSNLAEYPGINLIIYGVFLVCIMIYYPGGLASAYYYLVKKFEHNAFISFMCGRKAVVKSE